ncbi:monovalent cation/H+ antiporter complex subunit F [Elusimicrobiota bacterium]
MKTHRWILGLIFVLGFIAIDIVLPENMFLRWFYILLFSCFIVLLRLFIGPTACDRASAFKILSVIVIGFCGILTAVTGEDLYIDIAIAWTIQAFIGTIALAKYLEGKALDD